MGLLVVGISAATAHGPGYGPMGPGMMMGPGYGPMGPGMMMGPGYGPMGPGMMMGPGYGPMGQGTELSIDQVRNFLEANLQRAGNPRLKIGSVKEKDKETIVAEIVTVDNSLVARYEIDRRSGFTRLAQ